MTSSALTSLDMSSKAFNSEFLFEYYFINRNNESNKKIDNTKCYGRIYQKYLKIIFELGESRDILNNRVTCRG